MNQIMLLFWVLLATQPAKELSNDSLILQFHSRPIETNNSKDTGLNNSSYELCSLRPFPTGSIQIRLERTTEPTGYDKGNPDWKFLIAIAGLFVSTILALISTMQYRHSRKSSEVQLRAYVAVAPNQEFFWIQPRAVPPSDLFSQQKRGNSPEIWRTQPIQLKLINSGQTPAYGAMAWIKGDVGSPDYPVDFNMLPPTRDTKRFFPVLHGALAAYSPELAHGGECESEHLPFGANLTAFYWGRIEYRDAFEKEHYTNFRFTVEAIAPNRMGVVTSNMPNTYNHARILFTEDGNESD